MSKESSSALGNKFFEALKQINSHGAEYWAESDLQYTLAIVNGNALSKLWNPP